VTITTYTRRPSAAQRVTPVRRQIAAYRSPETVRAESAALSRLRLIFLAFALFNGATLIPLILINSGNTTAGLHVAAFAAIALFGSWWIWGYKNGSRWPMDVVEAVGLLVIGLAVGRPANAIEIFYAVIIFRCLYGSRVRASVRTAMFLGAYTVIVVASSGQMFKDFIANAFGLVFTAVVAQVIAESLQSHERALKRERILRQLGAMLGRFRDDHTMRESVIAALHALVATDATARVSIARGTVHDMTTVAAAGDKADALRDGHAVMSKLPSGLLDALLTNHVIRPTADESAALPKDFVRKPYVVLAPLIVAGELIGLLTFGSDHALPADFDEVLSILASQVSMWLEAQQTDSLLRDKDRERARLLRHLVIAQEDERKLIAGDIHDDSIQQMAAVSIRLSTLRKHLNDAGALETLTKVEGSVTSSIGRLRSLMFRLRPPSLDEGGLAPALREQLSATAEECSFKWELTSDVIVEPVIEVRVPAFRIAQEAIANVRKHADAKNVSINISTRDGGLLVKVRDDGVGFSSDPEAQEIGHLGVTSMRERAEICGGTYSLTSSLGHGTTVEFWIPESLNPQGAIA